MLASSPRPLRVSELPYEFRERQHGESTLDTRIAWEYMMRIAYKLIGHIVPVRFALFALVGGIGLFVHMAVLWFALTSARSRMSASPATSFPRTRSGGSPALPASSSDRSGTTPCRPFSRGRKNNIANEALADRQYPDVGRSAG
jgi:hypothetical protein